MNGMNRTYSLCPFMPRINFREKELIISNEIRQETDWKEQYLYIQYEKGVQQ